MTDGNRVSINTRVTIEEAKDRIRKSPNDFSNHGLLGELLYGAERYSESIDPLRKAAELLKNQMDNNDGYIGGYPMEMNTRFLHSLHSMCGDAFLKIKKFSDAISEFQKAVEIIDNEPETWHLLGIAQANSNNIRDAMRSLREAVRINPTRHDIWRDLQKLYGSQKRTESQQIDIIFSGKRDVEDDFQLLIDFFIGAAEYDKAFQVINQLLEWNNEDIRALIPKAQLLLITGNIEDAKEILLTINESKQKTADTMWNLSRIHCIEKELDETMNGIHMVLELEPNHRNAVLLNKIISSETTLPKQIFGVLSYEEGYIEEEDGKPQRMDEITYFPSLELPLGSTVEDALHYLVQGNIAKFTDRESLKTICTHLIPSGSGRGYSCHALPSFGMEFRGREPNSFDVSYFQFGKIRVMKPSKQSTNLICSGDIIAFLNSTMNIANRLQMISLFRGIKHRAEEKLANWPYRDS